jgi:hypothetical protein
MENFFTAVGTAFIITLLVLIILGLPLMLLWNWLMPYLFSLPEIGFLQAIGLNCLCSILFRSYNSNNNK